MRTAGVAVAAGLLAACAGPVLSSAPAELKAQAQSTTLAQCREAARFTSGVVFQDLAEAYAHRTSDEAFAAYMNEWLGGLGIQAQDMLTECQGL